MPDYGVIGAALTASTGTLATAFVLPLLITAILSFATIQLCRRCGWVCRPRADRWHSGRPAFFGGVPIWLGLVGSAAFFLPAAHIEAWKMIATSSLMFGLGLMDDVRRLSAGHKLLLQVVIALVAVSSGTYCLVTESILLNGTLSLLWIVGITNAFNLLDNMDGLSPGVGVITSIALAILFGGDENFTLCTLCLLLAGSLSGFLLFNFHPARIFMGDCGSLFLGFSLASLSWVWAADGHSRLPDLWAMGLLFSVPLLDMGLVSFSRRMRGQPISQGGTDHSSHRLVRLGFQDAQAVLLLYGVAGLSAVIALFGRSLLPSWNVSLMASCTLALAGLGIHLFRRTDPAMRMMTKLRTVAAPQVEGADYIAAESARTVISSKTRATAVPGHDMAITS